MFSRTMCQDKYTPSPYLLRLLNTTVFNVVTKRYNNFLPIITSGTYLSLEKPTMSQKELPLQQIF